MKVAIFFGSKSDKDTMKKAADVLAEFGVEYKAFIISAHRAGELLRKTVQEIEKDGFEVIIAGAGLAAALPGVIAGITTLPVIGVPLEVGSADGDDLGGTASAGLLIGFRNLDIEAFETIRNGSSVDVDHVPLSF